MDAELLAMVGGLALLDMLSPATIAVTLYLLLSNQKKLTQALLVYLSTVAIFYFLVGVLFMSGLDMLISTFSNIFQNRIISWIVFSLGVVLFIGSFYLPEKQNRLAYQPKSFSILSMVGLGFTTCLIEVGTAFPYFAAIGIMATSPLTWSEWPLILMGYNFIMILPPLLLLGLYLLFREQIRAPLEKLRMKIADQSSSTLSWIICIVGLVLIFNSLDYL